MRKFCFVIRMLVILSICGCTQNNGYIGDIFGSWALMEVKADGIPLDLEKETVFSFQNKVVRIMKVSDNPFERDAKYGNFSISDDVLTLKFQTELSPDGDGNQFLMPGWVYFPEGEMPLVFEVRTLNGSRMELAIDNRGETYVYKFDRTW